ncbi:MAG: GtrA family protein [Novosphingobium sp.]|nr:GtrA family protein [Novosphingobium sp.]
MQAVALRLRKALLVRYFAASVLALGVDMGCFLALLALGTAPGPASAAAYSLGIVAHWLLSSRTVFTDAVAAEGIARTRQKALFVLSALIGLALTTAVVSGAAAFGADPRLAKLAAVAVSFAATWLLRERIVFRPA